DLDPGGVMSLSRKMRALACAAVLFLSAGCSPQPSEEAPPSAESSDALSTDSIRGGAGSASVREDRARTTMGSSEELRGSLAATARGSSLELHGQRGGTVTETLKNPTATGVPLTFMVVSTKKDWVQVQVPVRPHGSTAWVAAGEVELTRVPYSLVVSTADNTLKLYRADELMETFPVATGTGGTPTPTGTFYLTELITPTNEGYGPFAYGLSAFSEELTSFGGGPGQIGLHGTDDESSLGEAVSHGCIRLSNPAITQLSAILPLGTPIEIT
ncbi:MAG: L,D-transpeptidase, partial [Ornithinimicrobium sp.]